jgi:enoyl-CoA hydratase/carnithine racemase
MTVSVHSNAGVSILNLSRPKRANAYDRAMLERLDEALAGITTAVLVLQTAGERAFCGGADLKALGQARPSDALDLYSQAVFERLAAAPFVSIAAIQGAAVAGGFELALACDLRVAGPRASFSLPETAIGLLPSAGGTTRLADLVGPGRVREVILGGRVIDAETALAWGVVNRLAADPRDEAAQWAAQIATRDPLALRLAKRVLDARQDRRPGLALERSTEAVLYAARADSKPG